MASNGKLESVCVCLVTVPVVLAVSGQAAVRQLLVPFVDIFSSNRYMGGVTLGWGEYDQINHHNSKVRTFFFNF